MCQSYVEIFMVFHCSIINRWNVIAELLCTNRYCECFSLSDVVTATPSGSYWEKMKWITPHIPMRTYLQFHPQAEAQLVFQPTKDIHSWGFPQSTDKLLLESPPPILPDLQKQYGCLEQKTVAWVTKEHVKENQCLTVIIFYSDCFLHNIKPNSSVVVGELQQGNVECFVKFQGTVVIHCNICTLWPTTFSNCDVGHIGIVVPWCCSGSCVNRKSVSLALQKSYTRVLPYPLLQVWGRMETPQGSLVSRHGEPHTLWVLQLHQPCRKLSLDQMLQLKRKGIQFSSGLYIIPWKQYYIREVVKPNQERSSLEWDWNISPQKARKN